MVELSPEFADRQTPSPQQSTPLYPQVHVKLLDLLDDLDDPRNPWKLINRCAFAAKRAGVTICAIKRFLNFATSLINHLV